jgi:hypothetical protein
MRYLLPMFIGLLVLAGCGPDPDAGLYGKPVSLRDADRQYKARLLKLVDGQTTRADIEAVMGDPDQADADSNVIMYYWTVRERDSDNIVRSFVIGQFDARGKLVRHQQYDHAAQFGGPKLPEEALNEFLGVPAK